MSAAGSLFHAALFDLDDTLYHNDEIRSHVGESIYMLDNLGFSDRDVAFRKCKELYIDFGTTYAGLVAEGYELDADHFHEAVHSSIDYERYLQPDPELRELLLSLRLPLFVFTNSDLQHAERCLRDLGISECFQGIVHFENIQEEAKLSGIPHANMPIICKPHPLSYHLAVSLVHRFDNTIPPPPSYPYSAPSTALQNYIFFDDSARNVPAALELGMTSVLIRPEAPKDIPCSLSATSILALKDVLPQLLNKPEVSPSESLTTRSSSAASLEPSHQTNHNNHKPGLSRGILTSHVPQPAAGASVVAPASVPVFVATNLTSHAVQPSQQFADDPDSELQSYEMDTAPSEHAHACTSYRVSGDVEAVPSTIDTVQHHSMTQNSTARLHGNYACASADLQGGLGSGQAAGGTSGGLDTQCDVLKGDEGLPERSRGAGSCSETCESSQMYEADFQFYDSNSNSNLNSAAAKAQMPAHCPADEDCADLLTKVSSFLEAVRQSVSAHGNPEMGEFTPACDDEWSGGDSDGRWGSEALELDLEDVVSRDVVHANSVQKAIEAEADHWEDELLIRELGDLLRRPAHPQHSLVGSTTGGGGGGTARFEALQTREVWDAACMQHNSAPLGAAETAKRESEGSDGAVQSVPEALRRAARAGRHVWVHTHM